MAKSQANKKLNNIDAVKKMLDGSHRLQTRTKTGYTPKKDTERHEIGDIWTDSNGVEWEQKDGYRVKNPSRAKRMQEIRDFLQHPDHCPGCKNKMEKRLDKKFFQMYRHCMDCQIDIENKMRIDGSYKDWERKKILENVKSWLADAEREKEVVKEQLSKSEFIHKDGRVEKWELPYDVAEMQQRVDEQFEGFKKRLLTQYNATETEIAEILGEDNGEIRTE